MEFGCSTEFRVVAKVYRVDTHLYTSERGGNPGWGWGVIGSDVMDLDIFIYVSICFYMCFYIFLHLRYIYHIYIIYIYYQ